MAIVWPRKWKWPRSLAGWDNYILYLLLFLILPLMPIGLEWIIRESISEGSLLIATAMYAISIGIASRMKALFGLTLIISLMFTCLYGVTTYAERKKKDDIAELLKSQTLDVSAIRKELDKANEDALPFACRVWAVIALILVTIIHAGDRFMRHVILNQPVFDF